eukprot:TRINITY_DN113129_c0_g1_i1.p1 TRINITY_DN113129_c0_g1~~TRINITY_DN113129_c0_g1_i1.p1  ORF type:complete len:130 (-),score=32.93 TRINITY_DN113129_c0_g1_i1:22-411(-)
MASLTDEDLLPLVEKLTDDGFLDFVDDFAEEHAVLFAMTDGEEHKHCFHEIHCKYQRLFESRAEAFLTERGLSHEALLEAASRGGLAKDVAEELLAVSDFQAFVAMMRQRASNPADADEDVSFSTQRRF